MKMIDRIKSKSTDEFIDWLNEYVAFDTAPWMQWWDNKYCRKCGAEEVYDVDRDRDMEYAWCEVSGKCKFFENMDNVPDAKQIIKMWLESEDNYGV